MSPLVTPKKPLAFTAMESETLRRFYSFRTDIPRNEPLGAPDSAPQRNVATFHKVLVPFSASHVIAIDS